MEFGDLALPEATLGAKHESIC
ncbi:hypothetical protein CCACVL1_03786 [Corchorus capsularis]|uniref:Uncharacterized protein n=1 Tax=Corchorus capsularis TaxID=210143 RepID=A0A1R3JX94_COCAP|nr:hypothetical protein CCACVL1_03786 [Corchorus capsularis]